MELCPYDFFYSQLLTFDFGLLTFFTNFAT